MPNYKVYTREIACSDCGQIRIIYKYSKPRFCTNCGPKNLPKRTKPDPRRNGENRKCLVCPNEFYTNQSANKIVCSRACLIIHRKSKIALEVRFCKCCDSVFEFRDYGTSNAKGSYCSIKCRNDHYRSSAVHYGFEGKRPGWNSVRRKFLKENPFCSFCGIFGVRLHVHHIVPYRLTQDDGISNLVTLCPKHHSRFEKLSLEVERLGLKVGHDLAQVIGYYFHERWVDIAYALNFKKADILNDRFTIRSNRHSKVKSIQEKFQETFFTAN